MSVIVVPDALPDEPVAVLRVLTDSEYRARKPATAPIPIPIPMPIPRDPAERSGDVGR